MLKLVSSAPSVALVAHKSYAPNPFVQLNSIALVFLEAEFERYLASHLLTKWPSIKILRRCTFEQLSARKEAQPQLVICGIEPKLAPILPTIWLSEIERSASLVQLYPKLWKTTTPITGRDLLRAIELVLSQ